MRTDAEEVADVQSACDVAVGELPAGAAPTATATVFTANTKLNAAARQLVTLVNELKAALEVDKTKVGAIHDAIVAMDLELARVFI